MKIKNLEFFSNKTSDKSFWQSASNKADFEGPIFLYKNLYEDEYKNYKILGNFDEKQWIVVLNKVAYNLLNLVDGKRNLRQIYKIYKGLKFKWLILNQELSKSLSLKDVIKEITSPQNLTLEDLGLFFYFLHQHKVIHFGSPAFELNEQNQLNENKRQIAAWIQITNDCNFRCDYCFLQRNPVNMPYKTLVETIDRVYESAQRNQIKDILIELTGGEPLLRLKEIKKIIEYLNKKDNELGLISKRRLFTNGSLITKEIACFLKNNNFRLGVSLDGIGPWHDRQSKNVAGQDTFQVVERGINILLDEGVDFFILTTVTKINLPGLPELIEYLLKNKIRFSCNLVRKNPLVSDELIPTTEDLIKWIPRVYEVIQKNLPQYFIANTLTSNVPDLGYGAHKCGIGKGVLAIDEKGNYFTCALLFYDKSKALGNVFQNKDFYSLATSQEVLKENLPIKEKTDCAACQYKYLCGDEFCPLSIYFTYNSFKQPAPYCSAFKVLIPQALRLEAERLIKYF